jgi:hypothetical protein
VGVYFEFQFVGGVLESGCGGLVGREFGVEVT